METVSNSTLTATTDASSISPWLILMVVGCVLIAVKAVLSLITQLVIIFVLTAAVFYLVQLWREPSTFADCLQKLTSACTTSLNVISNGKFDTMSNWTTEGHCAPNWDASIDEKAIVDTENWECIGLMYNDWRRALDNTVRPIWRHKTQNRIFVAYSLSHLPEH